ncbi:MAG: class I SAM-dependent methyltransferase [Actinobacteria bacterium]|nr:class I SAM-dependent methyltransferase [Actinomycetota bacterium]
MAEDPTDLLAAARRGDPAWFERLYAEAAGDPGRIPWASLTPHPYLSNWLRTADGEDRRAVVVGCGLGDDAEALASAGFDVTAFDLSPTAIAWARTRFPVSAVDYQVADLFQLGADWAHAFDVVWEARTIQSLPPDRHADAATAIGRIVGDFGIVLVDLLVAVGAHGWQGPPWPVAPEALRGFTDAGVAETDRTELAQVDPGVREVVLHLSRLPRG